MKQYHPISVTLNLFPGPSSLHVQNVEDGWMLKQVQHDDVALEVAE
ncbi:MAG: hypothetical protein KBF53_01240 [Sphingobium sp.]|nr:hypothetical protein [Sphingobium sp.]